VWAELARRPAACCEQAPRSLTWHAADAEPLDELPPPHFSSPVPLVPLAPLFFSWLSPHPSCPLSPPPACLGRPPPPRGVSRPPAATPPPSSTGTGSGGWRRDHAAPMRFRTRICTGRVGSLLRTLGAAPCCRRGGRAPAAGAARRGTPLWRAPPHAAAWGKPTLFSHGGR